MTSTPYPKASRQWQAGTLRYTLGGLVLLFCWLLWGDFAWSIRDRALPNAVQLLFRRFGASDTLVGLLCFSLPAMIGLVLGPVVGYKSDRLRSRWGRRIPFLLVPTPFIVLAIIGLAFAPQIGGVAHRLSGSLFSQDKTTLIFLGIFWTLFEIACVIVNSIFGALVNDVVPEAIIGRFFGLFRACSLIAAIILNGSVMGKIESHYVGIFLGVGALYGIGFTLMCLKVKEGDYPPPPALSEKSGKGGAAWTAMRDYFRDSFANPYYRWFFATSILGLLCTSPFNMYSVFYAKSLGMNLDFYFKCLAVTYGISLCLSYPLGMLVDRFHPLRIALVLTALYGATMAFGIFYVKDAASFTGLFIAHGVLSGSYFTAVSSLGQRILPKLKFAELTSAGNFLNSIAVMVLPLSLGLILDHYNHAYHYLFPASVILSASALGIGLIFYGQFQSLGGPRHYHPPE